MQPDPPDEVLAEKAKKGDMRAFDELFERYQRPVVSFVYRLLGSRETAEDVAQDVFANVYRNLDIFNTRKKFATWIFAIARNLARNARRDKKYFRDLPLEETLCERGKAVKIEDTLIDQGMTPDIAAEDKELSEKAQKILDSLPMKYKEVIILRGIREMSEKEIADILKCSVPAVSIRLKRGRRLFMKRMGMDLKP